MQSTYLGYYLYSFPIRLYRLIGIPVVFLWHVLLVKKGYFKRLLFDIAVIPFYCMDLIGIPEWYDWLMSIVKRSTKPLSSTFYKKSQVILGEQFPHALIKEDAQAKWFVRKFKIIYVSFFTINYDRSIQESTWIHELVHIWQYTRFGSSYILFALYAQTTKEGYNYGGRDVVIENAQINAPLTTYNFEQMADVIEDGYKLYKNLNAGLMVPPEEYQAYLYHTNLLKVIPIYRWNQWFW